MKNEDLLTVTEAYAAMYTFLDRIFAATHSDELGGLLGGMSLLPDGNPADPAAWSDWLHAVAIVKAGRANLELKLSKPKAT